MSVSGILTTAYLVISVSPAMRSSRTVNPKMLVPHEEENVCRDARGDAAYERSNILEPERNGNRSTQERKGKVSREAMTRRQRAKQGKVAKGVRQPAAGFKQRNSRWSLMFNLTCERGKVNASRLLVMKT
jgi:hypothetical protein